MCVIICCEKDYPSLDTLESAELLNSDGAGIAWLENKKVRWQKGLNAKEIYKITKKINLPFIVHFRIRSVGKINKKLCHPFPIVNNDKSALSGLNDEVLFHNGTWREWSDTLNQVAKKCPYKNSNMSDSKAMAFLASKFGKHVLHFIDHTDNKIAILNKDGIQKIGDGWSFIDKVECSNDYFKYNTFDESWSHSKNCGCIACYEDNMDMDETIKDFKFHGYEDEEIEYIKQYMNKLGFDAFTFEEYQDIWGDLCEKYSER